MTDTITDFLGKKVLQTPPKIWDLDDEGEINGVYRETVHPRLWFAAGGFPETRHMSKGLVGLSIGYKCRELDGCIQALRIQAEELGLLEK